MTISKAQQKAVNKYVRENYDRVNVNMPKGQKDVIKSHAESRGESLNAFINRAILETMERENTPATSE
jgi:predicted HicB family RNase H-like nuclease